MFARPAALDLTELVIVLSNRKSNTSHRAARPALAQYFLDLGKGARRVAGARPQGVAPIWEQPVHKSSQLGKLLRSADDLQVRSLGQLFTRKSRLVGQWPKYMANRISRNSMLLVDKFSTGLVLKASVPFNRELVINRAA